MPLDRRFCLPNVYLNRRQFLGHLEAVLTSIDTLSEAMISAISMLKEEVLDSF